MELVALAVVVILAAWYTGFAKSARRLADMANTQVTVMQAEHKEKALARAVKLKVDAKSVKDAKEKLALLASIEL